MGNGETFWQSWFWRGLPNFEKLTSVCVESTESLANLSNPFRCYQQKKKVLNSRIQLFDYFHR
jgi:hypothetical protein